MCPGEEFWKVLLEPSTLKKLEVSYSSKMEAFGFYCMRST
jgi:hypothetical protein